MDYTQTSLRYDWTLYDHLETINMRTWPHFLMQSGIRDKAWKTVMKKYDYMQMVYKNASGDIVFFFNCVPLYIKDINDSLPHEGWDWALDVSYHATENNWNTLVGLQVVIMKEFLGMGISSFALSEMKKVAIENNLKHLIIPVRPTKKDQHPYLPMSDYMERKTSEGYYEDPWLRVHEKSGAEVLYPCNEAMKIEGSIEDWKQWTGLEFGQSGTYEIEGGLSPVYIDLEHDSGLYLEPNVWVKHFI